MHQIIASASLDTTEILRAALKMLPSHSHCRDMVETYTPDGVVAAEPDSVLAFAYDAAYSCVEGFGHHTAPEFYGMPR